MLKNYILTALRNMKRYKTFTLINCTGLSIGLAMCMLVIMIVSYQMQADRYNSRSQDIFRVTVRHLDNSGPFSTYATVPLPMAEELRDLSGISQVVSLRRGFGNSWVGELDDPTVPVSGFFVDPEFLNFFELNLLAGNPETALQDPFSVVLTEHAARKIFGSLDVLGETLDMDQTGLYTVTGIIRDESRISHFSFDAVASMASARALESAQESRAVLDSWEAVTDGYVYAERLPGTPEADILAFMEKVNQSHYGDNDDANYQFLLQGLTRIKPGPLMANELGPVMPWFFVYILGGLGLVILLSSCLNYINLTIARSMNRAREVGVRKVSGASRRQVFFQFVVESVLFCLFAFLLAILLLKVLEPAFGQLNFARILQWELSYEWWVWSACLGFTLFIGVTAGVFPALTLSSFRPIAILNGLGTKNGVSRNFIRKAFIVSQFVLSLVFIISNMILYRQVDMMMHAQHGFESEKILTLPYDPETYEIIKNEISRFPGVENISRSSHLPAMGNVRSSTLKRSPDDEDNGMSYYGVDENYLANLGISLLYGRNLTPALPEHVESEVLLNLRAVSYLGFESPPDALGQPVYTSDSTALTVVGIIPDYHHEMMVMSIKPLALRALPDGYDYMQVRIEAADRHREKEAIVGVWKKHSPGKLGRFSYLDELITDSYDLIFGDLIQVMLLVSGIAIFIACLGLLGITVFTTQLRVREISIRKVLGAADMQLFSNLAQGFARLILIAIVLAVPISWFLNQKWLELLAYRIAMSPWYFVAGVGLILILAALTIGFQIFRVIRTNPAISLRSE